MNEYEEKIAIKKRLISYYKKQRVKNGLSDMRKIKAYLPDEMNFLQLRRDIVIAHLEFEPILELIADKKEFVVISGLNPSSPLHLGHKVLFDVLLNLQKLGGRIYIPLTNDESYIDGKVESMRESRRLAYEEILPSIIGFGFNPKMTHVFVNTDYPSLYPFAIRVSKYVSVGEVEALFGGESLTTPGQVFYRGCHQLAQILLPQLPEFGGPKHTLIPVGIDQHPYILLARDVAKRMKLIPPSELVIRFAPSLKNPEEKMSGSKSETAIYLNDDEQSISKKIQSAYTGSVRSLEEHRKYGAVPEACSVFALFHYHHPDDVYVQSVYDNYVKGELISGELKTLATVFVTKLVLDEQRKKSAVEDYKNFLLTQPIEL